MLQVLIYGWYGKGNVGDELMAAAFRHLLEPRDCKVKFVGTITAAELRTSDAVIFGGGSILYGKPSLDPEAERMLLAGERPIFYAGIGMETEIHSVHKALLAKANIVATRSPKYDPSLSTNVRIIPDLVYSLPSPTSNAPPGEGILVLPNIEVLPIHSDPHWKHIGWERFKDEFAQFLDVAVEDMKLRPSFMLMCKNRTMDDRWPAHELIGRMKRRSPEYEIIQPSSDITELLFEIRRFKVVVTQRFHGIILAQMAGVPHVSIDHHDKLKNAWPRAGVSVSYPGFAKYLAVEGCKQALTAPRTPFPVSQAQYCALADDIVSIIEQERADRELKQVRGNS